MRIGTLLAAPTTYSQFGRLKDEFGNVYTVEPRAFPEEIDEVEQNTEYAYKVELWSGDSGLVYALGDEDGYFSNDSGYGSVGDDDDY